MPDDLQAMEKDELVAKLGEMLDKDQLVSVIQTVEQGHFANMIYVTAPPEETTNADADEAPEGDSNA